MWRMQSHAISTGHRYSIKTSLDNNITMGLQSGHDQKEASVAR